MTFTASLAELSIFIIAISFLILVVSIIPTLIQLRLAGKVVQQFSEEGKKFLADARELTGKVNSQVEDMEGVVKRVKEVGLKVANTVEGVTDAARPMVTVAGIMAGVLFGLRHLRKGGGKDVRE